MRRQSLADSGSATVTSGRAWLATALALGFTTAPASAQDDAATSNDYLDALKTCRQLAEPEARLACYDQAVGRVVAASEAGEVRIVDKQEVESTRRGLFGFSLPKIGLFSGDAEPMATLESEITSVRRIRSDAYVFAIAEGSVWQINNAPMRLRPPRVGDKVEFKRAAMTSYFIRIGGQTGVKGNRIE